MIKNDKNVVNTRKTLSKRLAMLVATAVAVNQIVSVAIPVAANDINETSTIESVIEEVSPLSDDVYTVLFDGTEKCDWKTLIGDGTHTVENGFLKITRDSTANNEFTFFDQNAPQMKDGEAEMVFKVDGEASKGVGRFGFVLRPQTDGAYLFIGYDLGSNWRIATKEGANKDFQGPSLTPGEEYKMKVRFEGKKLTLWLNDEQIFSEEVTLNGMPVDSSYGIGFKTWYGLNDSYVDYFRVGPVGSLDEKLPLKPIESIENVTLETYVRVRPTLPQKVNVAYEDGTLGSEYVNWDYISSDRFANEGSFEVTGTLADREDVVTATVTVKADPQDGTLIPPQVTIEEKVLQSGNMKVVLDNNFPRVIRYEVGEEVLTGEDEQLYLVELNEDNYIPTVEFEQVDDKTANYTMTFEELDLVIKLQMSLVEDNILRMEVTDIIEKGGFLVRTLNFPGHSLASVKSTENGQISSVLTTGDWNNIKESFEAVSDVKNGSHTKTYGIINDDKFAIAIDNNVIEGGNRLVVDVENRGEYKKAGLANGTWIYRESLKSASAPAFIGNIGGVEINGSTNQPIFSNDSKIRTYMNKEYEAVYCGLGGVEDFEGLDLTGKVAIVDRGTHTFEDKAKNAQAAGAAYIICINNVSGPVPEQGYKDTINMVGLSNEYGDLIKSTLDENKTTTVKLNLVDSGVVDGTEELPWSQVMIATDTNENGKVTWQDAAILYRENMDEVMGADYVRNSFSYIPFNIGSLAQSPFLYTGDMVKKLSNYTDGFGQLVLEKGYQAEGHDDAIADIGGHTGIRQGGKDDLNTLIEIGKDYNARIGVHVNATEYHLDAFELDVDNLKPGFSKGWAWKDTSYYVDQKLDVVTGELERRFEMLKEDHPDLSWIYVDVYTGNGWNAQQLAEIIQNNDWMVATEFNGPLEQQTAWTHWGGDPAYPNRGNESEMIRFIRNQEQDVFMSDDLLKGAKHSLSGGWGNSHDVEGFYAMGTFYNHTLPSKYMQHFEIQEWEDDGTEGGFVRFNNGLEVIRENGYNNMYQDGKLISSTQQSTIDERGIGETTLFIPWTWEQLGDDVENKIYHWNLYGGETTWEIPNAWEGTQTVKLYELSDLGRTFVEQIEVVNGTVTIDAKEDTPYVLFQEEVSEDRLDNWGEGSLISDPGFDSQTFNSWNVESTSDNTDHVVIINEQVQGRMGNDAVEIQGAADAKLSQEITGLEPGKTYIASVWVKNYGDREITLGFKTGEVEVTSIIEKETTRINGGQGLKWNEEAATRMRVEFKVPEGVTDGTLYLEVAENEAASKVLIDDFRIWTNPLGSEATNREGYVLYEDFENVDEGHGPLYMGEVLRDDSRTHFAEKNPEGGQYMNWVIDGRFSLKTNQQDGSVGEISVTDQSTLQLKPNTTYEVGVEYTNKLDNLYSISINSPTAGLLFKETLTPGTVIGTPEDGSNYIREVKEFKYEFTTGDADDYYLAINKGYGYDELVIDNLYIKDLTEEVIVGDTTALEIAVEIANEVTESDLANVVPAVVTEFRAALEEAKAILAKENATEAEINASFDRLSAVMQMLSFEKGDKEALGLLIERINGLNGDEYISNTWTNLQTALEVANAVMVDENAMENEVSETYKSLLRSFLELRLKPSKDKLNDLINKVQTLDSSKYTAKSWKAVEAAVEKANAVMNNEDATEDEIANAEKSLQSAIDGLKETASSGSNSESSNNGSTNNSGSNNVASGTGSNNSSNTSNSGKLPNTGGVNSLWVALTGVLAAGAGFLTRRKK